MNDDNDRFRPPDPRHERLVALLYGELSAADAEAIRREIDTDPDLRQVWEEIRSAREDLGFLSAAESEPSPAWEPLETQLAPRTRATSSGAGLRLPARPRHRLRELILGSAWGVAAAALLLLALGLSHFRIERVDGGLAFRAGAKREAPATLANVGAATAPGGIAAPGAGTTALAVAEYRAGGATSLTPAGSPVTPGESPFVTRDELSAYSAEIGRRLAVLLDDHARQRDTETAAWMQVALEELSRRQARDYGDLRYQIEQVGIGLARGQSQANQQINWLLRSDRTEPNAPAVVPVNKEGDTP